MSLLGKIFVVVNAILALVFLGVTSADYYHHTNWREANERYRDRIQKVLEAHNAAQDKLKGQLTEAEKARETAEAIQAQLKDLNKSFEDKVLDATKQLNQKQAEYDQIAGVNRTLAGSIESKDKDLADSRSRIDQLTSDLGTSLQNKETAEAQVARLIGQKAALEKDLGEVRKEYAKTKQELLDMQLAMDELRRVGVPVGTILVNHKPVPSISGKVAGIKTDTQPALVLLNVGKDDGVERGFTFHVYRGSEFIGNVIVEKVNADTAGCRVLFTAPGKQIKASDDAATRLE